MKIAIIGTTKADNPQIIKKAKEIGKLIAINKHTIITGGTNGYPHIVALSAINAGGKVISYATGRSMSDHSQFHDADLSEYTDIIFQKKYFSKKLSVIDNYLRSLDMCSKVDMAIVISGKVGTMYEVTIMSGMSKNIYVLAGSGGVTGHTIKEFIKEGHKTKSKILFFKNSEELNKVLKK